MIIFIIFIQILSSGSQLFNFPSPELSFHKQEMPIKPGQLQQEQKNTSQVSFMSGSKVIWTERRMMNSVLKVCLDFFSRHENYI